MARSTGTFRHHLRRFLREYAEMTERRIILDRPWLHDELHWGYDAQGRPHLHGTEPGTPSSRGPVTRGGWCPCHRDLRVFSDPTSR